MVINVTYTDTCANLGDLTFEGVYNGTPWHDPDIDAVVKRASKEGVKRMIVPGSTQRMTQILLHTVKKQEKCFPTVAIHPNRVNAHDHPEGSDMYKQKLIRMCMKFDRVVAIGRTGLDFTIDGLDAVPKPVQITYLKMHLDVCKELGMPILLRCDKAFNETVELLEQYEGAIKGVIHTFEGSIEEARTFQKLGLYIGITGCALKSEKSVEMLKAVPLKRLLLGTNCPNCRIKESYFGFEYIKTKLPSIKKSEWNKETMVKGRNEPIMVKQVVEAVAGLRNMKPEMLALLNEANTNLLFFSSHPSFPSPDGFTTIDKSKLLSINQSKLMSIDQSKLLQLN